MKRVRGLTTTPPKLADYLGELEVRQEPHDYDTFRDHRIPGQAKEFSPYVELQEKLHEAQHGLCAYCEIQISLGGPFQVEHYLPKKDRPERHLDYRNLLGCCPGGDNPNFAHLGPAYEGHFVPPPKKNRSCGATKGHAEPDAPDARILDPRSIPLRPSSNALPQIVKVETDGTMVANDSECDAIGLSPQIVEETIRMLNLNAPRLQLSRKNLWTALKKRESPPFTTDLVVSQLAPNSEAQKPPTLKNFWSTRRCYLNSLPEQPDVAEAWLATEEAKRALC